MKYCFYSLLCAGFALAQSNQSVSALVIPDLNGSQVEAAIYTAMDGDHTELSQSINGGEVPLQNSETHVLSDTPALRTTETIVHKYNATGQVVSTERTVVETEKRPSGAVIHATVYQSDLNGAMQESERRTIETQVQGATSTSDVSIARAGLNGSFEVAEKRNIVTVTEPNHVKETEVIQRVGQSGQFEEMASKVRDETKTGDQVTATTASYEPDFTGKMNLIRQQVETTTKAPDGSSVTETNLYAPNVYGIARQEDGAPKLKEQDVTVRHEKNGVVTETTTVSRPTLQDPNRLGPATVASEYVCTGKCAGPLQP